ncbi:MAG: NifU family protein [Acholeplasmatales bacterium]|nr:NifU family protein [Acholeplasmatales bacterium]
MKIDEQLVSDLIDKVRPYLKRDGGDLEIVKIEDGIVYVKMLGACIDCMLLDNTIKDGIESMLLEHVPGVIGVTVVE